MRLVSSTMKTALFAVLALIVGLGDLSAQTSETRGTMVLTEGRRYMVAFPQVWASPTEKPMPQPMQLLISSRTDTKVRLQTPAGINDAAKIDKEYTVKANQVLKIPISTAYMNVESETRKGYGLLVTSKKPISVTTYQAWQGNGEMARHLPVEGWGKNYYTMNFYQDRYGTSAVGYKYRPSQIVVIADKDNTVVSYTPTFATEGGVETPSVAKGATQTVVLEKGETFLIKAKIDENFNKDFVTDLTGTLIRSSKPVGIVSGHTKVAIMRYPDVLPPTGMFAAEAHFVRNNVHDAMLPLEMAGKRFVTTPCRYTPTRVVGQGGAEFGIDDDRGDVIRVVALEDNTTIRAMRSNGDGMLNKWILRKGETRLETEVQEAVYWEADKPVLFGQYGKSYAKIIPPAIRNNGDKGGDEAQGHPTVESGMPMLQYIPSVDRWVEHAVFHAPEGMDNFMNIVFKASEVSKIKVDGRSLTSAFGGAMRLIRGTEFAYIAASLSAGDHYIESTDPSVRWVAWNYGSLDGLQQGRAYGTPVAVDMTIPCDDSLAVTEQIVCGDVVGEGKILPEETTCGSIFAVYEEELNNYELIVDEDISGLKKVDFRLNVLDKSKDATAKIKVVTRSGKFVEKTYTYVADKISWTPSKLDFGTIAFNTPTSLTFTIKNEKTDRAVEIRKIKVMANQQVFAVNPEGPFTLGPSESREITVTATIQTAPLIVDTVLVELPCYDQKTVELRVRGEEPKIYVSDVNYGTIPANAEATRTVTIQNGSRVDLIIAGYQESLLDGSGNFYNPVTMDGAPLKSAFPLTIGPNGSYEFKVTYSPKGAVGVPHRVDVPFYSNAKIVDSIAVLEGDGNDSKIDAIAEPWVERVIDVVQTRQNINEYTQRIVFYNVGAQPVTFEAPTITGPDAANFRIVDNGDAGSFPIQLVGGGAQERRYVTVAFVPTEQPGRAAERTYNAEIVWNTTSADGAKPLAEPLVGTAWQPQVRGENHDFGSFNTGDPIATYDITLRNEHRDTLSNPTTGDSKGTRDVVVTGITINDANSMFEILNPPTPQNPLIIKAGETPKITVRFNPTVAGDFRSTYTIYTNVGTNGQAPYEPEYELTARVQGGDFTVTGADATQYIFNSTTMQVRVRHDEATNIRFNIAQPSGNDASRFVVTDQFIDVPPGPQGATFDVVFTPDFVTKRMPGQSDISDSGYAFANKATTQYIRWRDGNFVANIDITDDRNGKVKTAVVSGDGIFLETANRGEEVGVEAGKMTEWGIKLEGTPESINGKNLKGIRVRVNYDPRLVMPRTNIADIITAGTATAGWEVIKVQKFGKAGDATNSLEIDLKAPAGANALADNGNPYLFKIKFDALLGQSQIGTLSTNVGIYTYWVDFNATGERLDYTLFQDYPGKINVSLTCATTTRLVAVGAVGYQVTPVRPNPVTNSGIISYSVGLTADTRIVLYNSMGEEVQTLVNERAVAGTYELTVDFTKLPAGTYYYRVVSGPFTSELQTVSVVK